MRDTVPPRRRNNVSSPSGGSGQTGLLLDDHGSLLTRLHVAKASFDHVEPFSLDLFRGFSSLRALTYKERFSKRRNPPESCWSLRENQVVVNAGNQELRSLRTDIPDWILDDTSSVAGLLTLKRRELEDFLGYSLKPKNPLQRIFALGR